MPLSTLVPHRLPTSVKSMALAGSRVLLSGSAHACPVCGGEFSRFIIRGPNHVCPGCGSLERHRVLALYLERELEILSGQSLVILHLAPDSALYGWLKGRPWLDYHTGDIEISERVDQRMDVRDLPFADRSVDLVICGHVLEHVETTGEVPGDLVALGEFRRILREGGRALIQVPISDDAVTLEDPRLTARERHLQYGQHDHVRKYGRDVVERFGASSLDVRRVSYLDEIPAATQERHLLRDLSNQRGSDIYECRKP